jgi:putative copper resistance protein D
MGSLEEPGLRLTQYAFLLGLFGWSAFRLIGLRKLAWLANERPHAFAVAATAAAPVVSTALMMLSVAAMMGQSIWALDWPMTEAMIVGTDMGSAFLARIALLVVALGAIIIFGRHAWGWGIAASCFAGALLTLGWSGHAAATEGALGLFHRVNNGLHLVAAGLWLGAIGWFLGLTIRCHKRQDGERTRQLLGAMRGFGPLGVSLVAVVGLTGLINSQLVFGLANVRDVIGTSYGLLLGSKVVLVVAMLVCGTVNASTSKAHFSADEQTGMHASEALAVVRRSLAAEFLLGVGVLMLVALLGTMSPIMP